jgi:hypothetical protein
MAISAIIFILCLFCSGKIRSEKFYWEKLHQALVFFSNSIS